MARVRRARDLFFSAPDGYFFDVLALLTGSVKLEPIRGIIAHSILKGEDYLLDCETFRALVNIPHDEWVDVSHLGRVGENSLADTLTIKGLLVKEDGTPEEVLMRDREEAMAQIPWNKYARLTHYMTKWRDVDLGLNLPEDLDDLSLIEMVGEDTFRQFREMYGKPPSHFKTVESLSQHDLPIERKDGQLYDALAARKTTRAFAHNVPLSQEDLATVLYHVYGCHGYSHIFDDVVGIKRTSPSGGGLHPTEVYPLVVHVEGLQSGLYHYNVEHHRLDRVSTLGQEEARALANVFTIGQHYPRWAHVLFIMTTRYYRNLWKYRGHPRAYHVQFMDAAHLSQTLYLVCADLGLGAFVTGAINAANIEDALGLDGISEGAVAICGCGPPMESTPGLEPQYLPYVPRVTTIGAQPLDQNNPISSDQINLQRSNIGQEHRPIRPASPTDEIYDRDRDAL